MTQYVITTTTDLTVSARGTWIYSRHKSPRTAAIYRAREQRRVKRRNGGTSYLGLYLRAVTPDGFLRRLTEAEEMDVLEAEIRFQYPNT